METEVLGRILSTLPADDDHPYRTGPWRPQHTERAADDLEVIGDLPDDLDGVYLRNTENPVHGALSGIYHPFDGDAMMHVVGFRDGEAFYRNRFVRTDGLLAEQEAGGPLWPGIAEKPTAARVDHGWGARGLLKDSSSTDVTVHNGQALTSFYQCGDLYQLDPLTLETRGKATWDGAFPSDLGVSAHPKVDLATGEMLFFNYGTEAPYMHYGVVDSSDTLVHYTEVPLPGPRLPHDMAYSENYAILNDCPLFWDPEALAHGKYANRFYPDIPTRLAVIPRRGSAEDIVWFEADPTFVLHWTNAYESGDEVILDGFFQKFPLPGDTGEGTAYERAFRFLAADRMGARLHRWHLNMRTGQVREYDLSDRVTEFGMINDRLRGQEYRYTFAAQNKPGWFLFNGVVKHDLLTGAETSYEFEEGVFCSETAMAPRVGATAEDDGYLITITVDMNRDLSECLVLDAQRVEDGPIARVRLPERVSSGTHSTWASGAEIPGWRTHDSMADALRL
ncbi:carotenoid cleavage dioxygenase [Dietzia kunjamensis subsp. schimae]|uniref:Dioxygenase n=1 Tax=Dietzia kunjamensis subsp. schimae TaxID=498198 RepID=A0ABY1MXC5_9ACTN|nr:carotenoid oxygenase family protein [Dietzia kunjamensis]MBB1016457.1 apocarotenoid-15,15'-oxygenase [Dietzia kunjamensis subsp. schimae]SMO41907.1 carotenoid cleavage dioxygenase [Dietzia kunjamensis subsp. schimae]